LYFSQAEKEKGRSSLPLFAGGQVVGVFIQNDATWRCKPTLLGRYPDSAAQLTTFQS
jgi:hypothetical protein